MTDRDARGRLLGLHGKAGAGKSTIARELCAEGVAALLHFASPIKACGRAVGLSEVQVNGDLKDTPCELLAGATPRHFLQGIGEYLRATYGARVVAGWTMVHAERLLAHGLDVVIDDVRLPSEAAAVWESQGIVIELTGRESTKLDKRAREAVTEERLADRWLHERVSNQAQADVVARVVRHCWHDLIAHTGTSRAW